jgi:hypothetical protein
VRAADAEGKRVVKVNQRRTTDDAGRAVWVVDSIDLSDGTRLVFTVREIPADYGVEVTAYRRTYKPLV